MKKHMGWKHAGPPAALRVENKIVRKPRELAEIQNAFFVNKVKDLMNKLPATGQDPLSTLKAALNRWGDKSNQIKTMKIQPVSRMHALNLINKLGYSSSFGTDGLDSMSPTRGQDDNT